MEGREYEGTLLEQSVGGRAGTGSRRSSGCHVAISWRQFAAAIHRAVARDGDASIVGPDTTDVHGTGSRAEHATDDGCPVRTARSLDHSRPTRARAQHWSWAD